MIILDISFDELFKIFNPNLIDIRSLEKYNDNHIPGAININYSSLINEPSRYLNRSSVYYIYCQKGITSKKAANILRSYGYNVINIIGGYEAYILSE